MSTTSICSTPYPVPTQTSNHYAPSLAPATPKHQTMSMGRAHLKLPVDHLLPKGVVLSHCISDFQQADKQLRYLNNRIIIFMTLSLCVSYSLYFRKHGDYGTHHSLFLSDHQRAIVFRHWWCQACHPPPAAQYWTPLTHRRTNSTPWCRRHPLPPTIFTPASHLRPSNLPFRPLCTNLTCFLHLSPPIFWCLRQQFFHTSLRSPREVAPVLAPFVSRHWPCTVVKRRLRLLQPRSKLYKNLWRGDAYWTSCKNILVLLVDTLRHEISPPSSCLSKVLSVLTEFPPVQNCASLQWWAQLVGILRSIAPALPGRGALFGQPKAHWSSQRYASNSHPDIMPSLHTDEIWPRTSVRTWLKSLKCSWHPPHGMAHTMYASGAWAAFSEYCASAYDYFICVWLLTSCITLPLTLATKVTNLWTGLRSPRRLHIYPSWCRERAP